MSDNPPDADAPTAPDSPRRGASLDSAANEAIELMFFAYRDFTDVADRILEHHDLGGPTTGHSISSARGRMSPSATCSIPSTSPSRAWRECCAA